MQTNVLQINTEVNYKLLFQTLMLICVGFIVVALTNSLPSSILGLTSVGMLLFNKFIYNPKQSKRFILQSVTGIIFGFITANIMHKFAVTIFPLAIILCFIVGFGIQINSFIVVALASLTSMFISYTNIDVSIIYLFLWFMGGLLTYFISCFLFDGYIDEHKLIATKRVDKVIVDGWQSIKQLNLSTDEQAFNQLNKQLDIMVAEITRLQVLRAEYDYYCKLDDNLECQIENNLNKLLSFHDLITKQVYNTILNQNQQLVAEEINQKFDESSD